MLVNSNDILSKALKEGYAVPAYNINNLEWAKYILEACNEDKSPVILAVTEKSVNYCGGFKVIYNMEKYQLFFIWITEAHLNHAKKQ